MATSHPKPKTPDEEAILDEFVRFTFMNQAIRKTAITPDVIEQPSNEQIKALPPVKKQNPATKHPKK